MTLINTLRIAGLSTLIFACAGIAAAQGPAAGIVTNSELEMTATVATAVQLNISTGTGGATVTGSNATGLFALNFGSVNGLGVGGTQSANVSVVSDATGALYTTPINLTPVFSGFTVENARITVAAGVDANQDLAREGASAISTTLPTTPVEVIAGAASGSTNARYVGFYIPRAEAAGVKTATLVYEVIVD